MSQSFRPRRPVKKKLKSSDERDAIIRRLKAEQSRAPDYRQRSLEAHGWVCAKCGRDFDNDNLHLLTVHHKDGNHNNNVIDNLENLCIYCHEDEHTRSLLGDYLSGSDDKD
ncbi:MAG: HNH endonuclease [Desulfuromonas sp.]|nr:MAG: HNH endonuclease [Desulfuromonas sp.]